MKYSTFRRTAALVAISLLACATPVFSQSNAYSSTASVAAYPSTSDSADDHSADDHSADDHSSDDQAGSLLTIHKRVDEVNVLFIATDKHGKFVRDLNQNDFAILDDHKPPQSIINFRRETDLPPGQAIIGMRVKDREIDRPEDLQNVNGATNDCILKPPGERQLTDRSWVVHLKQQGH